MGVLGGEEEAFGVRHESEDAAGGVSEAGDICERTIGVFGLWEELNLGGVSGFVGECGSARGPVAEGDLVLLTELIEDGRVLNGNSSLRVCDWYVKFVHAAEEDTVAGGDLEAHPAVCVAAVAVPRKRQAGLERGRGVGIDAGASQKAGFENGLEAIADSEHETIAEEEAADGLVELSAELSREDDTGAEVIAVTEAAWDAQDLILLQLRGRFQQPEQMDAFCCGPCHFEGMGRFEITICSGCPKHTHAGLHHRYRPALE